MSASHWRGRAEPIIRRIIEANAGKPVSEVKALISKAYPFGPRQYHPYKIWCDEVRRQLGEKPPLGTVVNGATAAKKVQAENPKQEKLL